jgi:hypothetical protein
MRHGVRVEQQEAVGITQTSGSIVFFSSEPGVGTSFAI